MIPASRVSCVITLKRPFISLIIAPWFFHGRPPPVFLNTIAAVLFSCVSNEGFFFYFYCPPFSMNCKEKKSIFKERMKKKALICIRAPVNYKNLNFYLEISLPFLHRFQCNENNQKPINTY